MADNPKQLIHPTLIPVISAPYFLLGGLLAAWNWHRLGAPQKSRATVKWCIIGTIAIAIIALYIPVETLKKLWSVGIGINLGTGMALRTIQLPEYYRATGQAKVR